MKKTSLLSALLFIGGVLVGGTAVFFFLRPAPLSTQVSEPVTAPSAAAPAPTTEITEEEMPQGLEEADEIPAEEAAEKHLEADSE